jgi:uncharacterized protein YvpB
VAAALVWACGGDASAASGRTIASSAAVTDNAASLYQLDGWGGVHAVGSSPPLNVSAYWGGWDIARAITIFTDGTGGYVMDGWGGVHAVGSAPLIPDRDHAYWPGWDIARAVQVAPWATASQPQGWSLDGWGGIHPFGGAPEVKLSAYWPGWDIARGMVVSPDSTPTSVSGVVLDGWGGLHSFGTGAPAPSPAASAYWGGWDIARSIALVPDSTAAAPKGYVLDGWGGLHPFGTAPAVTPSAYWGGWDIARSLTMWTGASTGAPSGWTFDGWGGVHAFGSASQPTSFAYWPGWDILRSTAGAGSGSGGKPLPPPPLPPLPTSRTISVPSYRQQYALSCEAAALRMILAYEGIASNDWDLMNVMGIDWRGPVVSNGLFRWGNPYTNFVGNPNGSQYNNTGYGTYHPPVARAARAYGGRVVASQEGLGPPDLYRYVLQGNPAVVWIAIDYAYHRNTAYYAYDGQLVQFGSPYEHAVALIGVTPDSVLVNDPARGQLWVSRGVFENTYATFNNMAVVMR